LAERLRVGSPGDFEEGLVYSVDFEGQDVAVVRFRGRFYAFSNRCTHWGVSLSDGWVNSAGQIICLLHDSAFDMRSGAVIDGPAGEDLVTYEVAVEGDDVLLGPPRT
jgi:3-phenylpropionate/trans-cinnamate dioxygenase ferredoxin component